MTTKKVQYSAIVLDEASHSKLLARIHVPEGWKTFAHHMTLCMGQLPESYKDRIGELVELVCIESGRTDTAIAVKVDNVKRIMPGTAHITVAVNVAEGGKPKDSNEITDWSRMHESFVLLGRIQEV